MFYVHFPLLQSTCSLRRIARLTHALNLLRRPGNAPQDLSVIIGIRNKCTTEAQRCTQYTGSNLLVPLATDTSTVGHDVLAVGPGKHFPLPSNMQVWHWFQNMPTLVALFVLLDQWPILLNWYYTLLYWWYAQPHWRCTCYIGTVNCFPGNGPFFGIFLRWGP